MEFEHKGLNCYDKAMIGYLEGIIRVATDKYLIIDVQGVGYRVTMPGKMMSIISDVGAQVKVFTHFILNPRDGSVELFGFGRPEELGFFELLTTVSGIGPRSAQSILSNVDLETLQVAIARGDSDMLTSLGGIGAKTAQRLVLELKNKIDTVHLANTQAGADFESEAQAVDALVALGYMRLEARDTIRALDTSFKTVEERVGQALRILGKNKK